jgi:hypothetical protein
MSWSLARALGALYGWTGDCIFIQYFALFKLYFKFARLRLPRARFAAAIAFSIQEYRS